MRKIIIWMRISLDGIMQAPSGPEEDPSENFRYGGWTVPYSLNNTLDELMRVPFDLLLGRKTYDIFASYWPSHGPSSIGVPFNKATKYLVSHHKPKLEWEKTVLVDGDVVKKLKELKKQEGPVLQVYGSSVLIQTLLKYDLVDELWLNIYPLTLGMGKKLFGEGTITAAFKLIKSEILPSGIIVAKYKRIGQVKTGKLA
jgi:dihydrofolate reductase